MIRTILFGAATIALASTAAMADPAADKLGAPKINQPAEQAELMISPERVATRDDAQKLADAEFLIADANVDGAVDKSEFETLVTAPDTSDPAIAPKIEKAFAAIAKNDGKISRQEMIEARSTSFDKADVNRDKNLDEGEKQIFAALVAIKPAAEIVAQ